jgi:DNA-binding NtrC family response regulator
MIPSRIFVAESANVDDIDVLVIDDEPLVLKMLAANLTHGGFTYRCAENGRAALPLLRHHRFKLIVTDIHMPDMDGLEVIMHCTASVPGVRILAMSGGGRYNNATDVLIPARILGSSKSLIKPFGGPQFLEAVQELISGSELPTRVAKTGPQCLGSEKA